MLSTYKIYNIYDSHDEREVKVKLFTTKHVTDRFNERSREKEENKVMSVIEKALHKIVNDYPFDNGEFIIKSNSLGIKIPMEVETEGEDLRVNIPTILSAYMKTSHGVPNLTLDIISWQLSVFGNRNRIYRK